MGETETETTEKTLDEIVSEIDQKFQTRLSEQENKIQEKLNSLKEKTVTESSWGAESDDEDVFITKKELKKIVGDLKNETQKEFPKVAEKILETKLEQKNVKTSRDTQAFKDFPALNQESKEYSPEFFTLVKKEIDGRISRGRSEDDPDLIYDCAAIVQATNPKFAYKLQDLARQETRVRDNEEGNFNIRKRSTNDVEQPSERQIELAKKFNLTEADLKKHFARQR